MIIKIPHISENHFTQKQIEELNVGDLLNNKITRNKFNELVQAVKQINKEAKELKNRSIGNEV